jgi:glycosyltransferase involved in cell wall biosynthesis
MRILVYFRAKVTANQGTPLRCRNLLAALADNKEISLRLLSSDDTAELQNLLPVEHAQLPLKNWTAALKEQVRDFKPDILYGQTHKAMRDMVHLTGLKKPKLVVDLHGDYPAERLEQYWRPYYRRLISYTRERLWERRALKKMDAFTIVSHNLAAHVRKYQKPIFVLWGGVNSSQFKPSPSTNSKPIQVTYAGNYSPYQGVPVLVQAAKILKAAQEPFHFNFIGNIDQFPDLRREIEQELAGQYTIIGQVPYAEVPGLLSGADILVIPRISDRAARYGFPSKLPEYMATGKALVITDVGEHANVVKNGETGLVIPPDSATALAEALLMLQDDNLRRRLGFQAREFIEQELTWDKIAENLYYFLVDLETGDSQGNLN